VATLAVASPLPPGANDGTAAAGDVDTLDAGPHLGGVGLRIGESRAERGGGQRFGGGARGLEISRTGSGPWTVAAALPAAAAEVRAPTR
jgi:hypothetical protein